MPNKKLVLFDLDGVLLDSKENMKIAWKAVCQTYQIATDFRYYFAEIGRPFKDILNLLGIYNNQQLIEDTFNTISTQHLNDIKIFPGVSSTLQTLINQQIKIGIITSKNYKKTNKILTLLGFDFDIVQTPNEYFRGKPAPDHLLYAIAKLNTDPKDALYVGDMQVDYEAAKRAGIDYAHAAWGYGQYNGENAMELNDVSELIKLI